MTAPERTKAARLRRLGAKGRSETGIFAMPTIDVARVEMLALKTDAKVDAPVAPADDIDDAALELARLSLVVPADTSSETARALGERFVRLVKTLSSTEPTPTPPTPPARDGGTPARPDQEAEEGSAERPEADGDK